MLVNILLIAFFVFLLIPLALVFWWVSTLQAVIRSSTKWRTTTGKIIQSCIVRNRNCNGLPGYHYAVSYEYSVGSETFVEDSVRCGKFYYFTKSLAQRTADAYPIGIIVQVFYDPEYPECTVLVPGWHPECLYCIFVFASFCIVEAIIMIVLVQRIVF